jgi:acyl-CoA dehydrogenase
MQAADQNDVAAFDAALCSHASHIMSLIARSLFHGLSGGRLQGAPVGGTRGRHYRRLARLCLAFAVTTEMALLSLGGSLKRKESLSGRLGDVLSLLYLGSAVLKHHHDHGEPDDELPLLEWACTDLQFTIQERLHEVFDNLPNRFVAALTRLMTFPLGRPCKRPRDAHGHSVAELVLSPGAVRERLTQGMYLPADANAPLARLDDALEKAIAAEPALRTLRRAMQEGTLPRGDPEACIDSGQSTGVITEQEAAGIRAAIAARRIVIQVDEFPPEYLTKEHAAWSSSRTAGKADQSM